MSAGKVIMVLTLPLTSPDDEVDYTLVDEIKFSRKKINGCERATAIMGAFSGHYHKEYKNGKWANAYREFYIEVEPKIFVSVRGYKNIVVCIVDDYYANFGPNGRAAASRKGCLFEEENNVFPFRQVLDKVREISKAREDARVQAELLEQEREFKFLSLEGMLVTDFGMECKSIHRRNHDRANIAIELILSPQHSWYRTIITDHGNDLYDLNICGNLPFTNISKDELFVILNPILKYHYNREEFYKEFNLVR